VQDIQKEPGQGRNLKGVKKKKEKMKTSRDAAKYLNPVIRHTEKKEAGRARGHFWWTKR